MSGNEQLISSILDELKELELLTLGMQNPEKLQELAVKKAKTLLQHYEQLKEAELSAETPAVAPKEETAKPEPVVSAPEPKQTISLEVKVVTPEAVVTPEVKVEPVVVEEKKVVEPETPKEEPVRVEQPKPEAEEPKVNTTPVQPEERKAQPSIQTNNDRFKQPTKPSYGKTYIESMYVKSLKSALNLNDKIRFSRELFGGDVSKLNATVEELDRKNNLGEALSYINANFDWDKENEAVAEFLSLLERRF